MTAGAPGPPWEGSDQACRSIAASRLGKRTSSYSATRYGAVSNLADPIDAASPLGRSVDQAAGVLPAKWPSHWALTREIWS